MLQPVVSLMTSGSQGKGSLVRLTYRGKTSGRRQSFAGRDREGQLLRPPDDRQDGLMRHAPVVEDPLQLIDAVDRFAVVSDDQVARFDTRGGGGTVRFDRLHAHSGGIRQLVVMGDAPRQR